MTPDTHQTVFNGPTIRTCAICRRNPADISVLNAVPVCHACLDDANARYALSQELEAKTAASILLARNDP